MYFTILTPAIAKKSVAGCHSTRPIIGSISYNIGRVDKVDKISHGSGMGKMRIGWQVLDDGQVRSGFETPPLYTGGQTLEKHSKTCHFLPLFGPLGGSHRAKPCSASSSMISTSNLTYLHTVSQRRSWHEMTEGGHSSSGLMFTISGSKVVCGSLIPCDRTRRAAIAAITGREVALDVLADSGST
jgi:hypothetical protein